MIPTLALVVGLSALLFSLIVRNHQEQTAWMRVMERRLDELSARIEGIWLEVRVAEKEQRGEIEAMSERIKGEGR